MAELVIQQINSNGLAPNFVAADTAGDTFKNDGTVFLHVKNSGAAAITATIDSKKPCDQGFDHNIEVQVPNGGERLIGPFSPTRFNDPATGMASVSYSAVTNVTVAVIKL